MCLCPRIHVLGEPDFAATEDGDRFREVGALRELEESLTADAAETHADLVAGEEVGGRISAICRPLAAPDCEIMDPVCGALLCLERPFRGVP
jgi:hypothetical protein